MGNHRISIAVTLVIIFLLILVRADKDRVLKENAPVMVHLAAQSDPFAVLEQKPNPFEGFDFTRPKDRTLEIAGRIALAIAAVLAALAFGLGLIYTLVFTVSAAVVSAIKLLKH
jgi:hypothetical protein